MSAAADLPTSARDRAPASDLPAEYRQLIADRQAHGIIGRPSPRQATAHREQLGLPTPPGGAWTAALLERWRDQAVDWLDTHLLRDCPAPAAPHEQARAVLALADVAVRDTWLIRFARAPHDAQTQAADRLAVIAPTAPESLRPPIGTVLTLAEWTIGRESVGDRLDWATSHGTADYRLAQLTRDLLDGGAPPTVFTHAIAGALTEQECRHPEVTGARPSPEAAGRTLTRRGWALHVDTQVDLPAGVAWTGTLTHESHPVATVSRHDADSSPVLYFPPGSREQATWAAALRSAGTSLTDAIAGLDHIATFGPRRAAAHPDPIASAAADGAERTSPGPRPAR